MTELTPKQLKAIEIELATAKKYIRDDLKAKFGYEKNKFFYLDLFEYRINNKLEDIAEDLDLEERYDLINNQPRISVGMAFRGHHNKEFKPDYRFNGLFSEEMNDIIEEIRYEKNGQKGGRKGGLIGGLIGGRATVETHGDQMRNGGLIGGRKGGLIGGRKLADMINPETGVGYLVEARRKSIEARGAFSWRDNLEYVLEIGELKYEKGLTWKETTTVMNEKYDKNWATATVRMAYQSNKDLLPDKEE
jgi:hypothetical protein